MSLSYPRHCLTRCNRRIAIVALIAASVPVAREAFAQTEPVASVDYAWSNVAMGGGGAVPGVIVHPRVPDLVYIRTDVGGAYRWDATAKRWTPLLEHVGPNEWNLYGVDSLAVDPSDATGNTLYASTGKYTLAWAKPAGVLMKSTDRGTTWKRLPLTPTGGSNQDQGLGERLAVDPANGQIVLYASRLIGLQRSDDAGATWAVVDAAPRGANQNDPDEKKRGSGLAFALFDPSQGTLAEPARTKTIYLGAHREGVFRSDDAGVTWRKLDGGPTNLRKAAIATDGTLLVTTGDGLMKFAAGAWTDVTPALKDRKGACGVAIDPANPKRYLVTRGESHNAKIFRSIDAGATWMDITGKRAPTVTWWPGWHWISNPFSIAFDPHHANRAWVTDWYGTYVCEDVAANPPVWTNYVAGHEEIVTIGALVAPPTGRYRLLSGCADIGGLDHESLDTPPAKIIWDKGVPGGMARTGIAISPSDPTFLASVFVHDWNKPGTGAYSTDGGETWTKFDGVPFEGARGGRVVVTGESNRILWLAQKADPCFSDDRGKTWTKCASAVSLAGAAHGDGIFVYDQPLAVDRADPQRVYILKGGTIHVSNDAGASFTPAASKGLPDFWASKIATTGAPNDLWVAAGEKGLVRSADAGASFQPIANVSQADLLCFGKSAEGKSFPTLFVKGVVNGTPGYFRSEDAGATWVQIDSPSQRVGNDPNTMTGDWREFGGVFVGTNGRGIYYGRPAAR